MSTSTSRDWGEAERPLVDIVEWQTDADEFKLFVTRTT